MVSNRRIKNEGQIYYAEFHVMLRCLWLVGEGRLKQ